MKKKSLVLPLLHSLTQTSVTSVESTDQGQAQPSAQSKNNDEETVTILRVQKYLFGSNKKSR